MSTKANLNSDFVTALSYIEKAGKKNGSITEEDQLELYGLHKQVVEGDCPLEEPEDSDERTRTKYQAWKKNHGRSKEECMDLYVQKVERLNPGFKDSIEAFKADENLGRIMVRRFWPFL